MLGLVLFELAVSRMGDDRALVRLDFYWLACWLVFPVLISMLNWWAFGEGRAVWLSFGQLFVMDLFMGGLISGVMLILRRRMADKT